MTDNQTMTNNNIQKPKWQQFITHRLVWWILLIIILLTATVRYRLLEIPLERDEGEYAYAGQLILQGIPPYQQLYNMKLPGIYAAYAAVLAIFGQTHGSIHLGLLFINAITIVLIFLLTKHLLLSGRNSQFLTSLFSLLTSLLAAACFAVLSMGQKIQGMLANSEHFVILPAVAGLYLLVRALDEDRSWLMFSSGFLLGTGFIVKQHGIAFVMFGGCYILACYLQKRPIAFKLLMLKCAVFTAGVILPYGITCLILAIAGVFDKFWFWTVDYAKAYASQVPLNQAWSIFKGQAWTVVKSSLLLWILAGVGLTAPIWDKQTRQHTAFIILFALFSFLAICPGFYFRHHYFILTLPAVSVLAGIGMNAVINRQSSIVNRQSLYAFPIVLTLICLTASIWQQRMFLFHMTPEQASRSIYGLNPFPESLEIAKFIRTFTKENDRIAVIGSEPQIYFYSGRQAATGYIYMYPLMEKHDFALQMQKEMVKEIESVMPEFLIFVNISTSWLKREDSHSYVFDWLQDYEKQHYLVAGMVELTDEKTSYSWGQEIKLPPSSPVWIAVLKLRKEKSDF